MRLFTRESHTQGVEPAQEKDMHVAGSKAKKAEPLRLWKLKISDIKLQDLKLALLGFSLALV